MEWTEWKEWRLKNLLMFFLSLFWKVVELKMPERKGALNNEVNRIAKKKRKVKSLNRVQLCDPMDCSLPGSSVHGIFQARVLEWVAISFSKGSSQPRARTMVSRIVDRRFTIWATREAYKQLVYNFSYSTLCIFNYILGVVFLVYIFTYVQTVTGI